MTSVKFHFVTPDGLPIADTDVTIEMPKSGFHDLEPGIIMPRDVVVKTGADGSVIVDLHPSTAPYLVTVLDMFSRAELSYRFYVPVLDRDDLIVRLQDIVVANNAAVKKAFEEAALLQVLEIKANVLATYDNILQAEVNTIDHARIAGEAAELATKVVPITSPTPPVNPVVNAQWFNSVSGRHYTYVQDASGHSQWVETYASQVVDNPAMMDALASPAGTSKVKHGPKQLNQALDALRNNAQLRTGERPMIIAHRGFDSTFPQNTLLAYSSAARAGADAIEMDVSFSADGVAYMFHDDTVDALTTGTGAFVNLTSAYIDTLRFKALVGSRLADEPVTRFADVLQWARKIGMPLVVELKQISDASQTEYFIRMIVEANMADLVSAQTGYLPNLALFRSFSPDINVGFVTADANYAPYVDGLAKLGNTAVNCLHDVVYANPAMIKYCADRGVDLMVYTIPDVFYQNRIAALGVTKFISSRYTRSIR